MSSFGEISISQSHQTCQFLPDIPPGAILWQVNFQPSFLYERIARTVGYFFFYWLCLVEEELLCWFLSSRKSVNFIRPYFTLTAHQISENQVLISLMWKLWLFVLFIFSLKIVRRVHFQLSRCDVKYIYYLLQRDKCCIVICRFMLNHNDAIYNKERSLLLKKYTSQFICKVRKGCAWEGVGERT